MKTLDDSVQEIINFARDMGFREAETFLGSTLNDFAADIVLAVLPDDPVAQQAVMRKAEAFGIDIGSSDKPEPPKGDGENVIDMIEHLRKR
jgi:hypothetical protein